MNLMWVPSILNKSSEMNFNQEFPIGNSPILCSYNALPPFHRLSSLLMRSPAVPVLSFRGRPWSATTAASCTASSARRSWMRVLLAKCHPGILPRILLWIGFSVAFGSHAATALRKFHGTSNWVSNEVMITANCYILYKTLLPPLY